MFDFANSSYTTIVVTVVYSVYFTKLVAGGSRFSDALWGLGVLVSNLLVVVASPVVGAMADDAGHKKRFLVFAYFACVAATALLYAVTPGRVALGLTLFVASNVAFSFGENFIAAFLPELSTPKTIGRISGFGWGLGYLGGLVSLLLVRPFLADGFVAENSSSLRVAFLLTAGFFLIAGLPTFVFLRERAPQGPKRSPVEAMRAGFSRLRHTARTVRNHAALARFLGAFFVYSSGLTTVLAFAAIYAEKTLGFTSNELIALFIVVQLSAALGAIVFGLIQDHVGAKRTIVATLCLWIAVVVAAFLVHSKSAFFGVVVFAGLGVGSVQSASRAMVGLLAPPEKTGEFFGFWGLAGKAAYAFGPAVFGLVSSVTGSQRLAILSTAAFFILGLWGLKNVKEKNVNPLNP